MLAKPEMKTPEEQKQDFILQLKNTDPKQLVPILEVLSMMVRAFEGKEVNPDSDQITRLINIKNILERSNFPSMTEINFQTYARLIAYYHPSECLAFEKWADFRAEALKSYKALSSEQYVEMFKAQNAVLPSPSTNINLASQQQMQQQKKQGWLRRRKEPDYQEEHE